MNRFTLSFIDCTLETKYQSAQFRTNKPAVSISMGIIIFVTYLLSIYNIVFGNKLLGVTYLILSIAYTLGYILMLSKMHLADIYIISVQLILSTIYPAIFYFSIDTGLQTNNYQIIDFVRALTVCQFCQRYVFILISIQLSSTYYLRAFHILYTMIIWLILMPRSSIAFHIQLIISCLVSMFAIYYKEKVKKIEFLKDNKNQILNMNILSNNRYPYFLCSGAIHDALKLVNSSQSAQKQFNIKCQDSFQRFIKKVLVNDNTLSTYLRLFFDNPLSEDVVKIFVTYELEEYQLSLSKFSEQDYQIAMVNIKKISKPKQDMSLYRLKSIFLDKFDNKFAIGSLKMKLFQIMVCHGINFNSKNSKIIIIDLLNNINQQRLCSFQIMIQKQIQTIYQSIVYMEQFFLQLTKLKANRIVISKFNQEQYDRSYFKMNNYSNIPNDVFIRIQVHYKESNPLHLQLIGYIAYQIGPFAYIIHRPTLKYLEAIIYLVLPEIPLPTSKEFNQQCFVQNY